MRIQAATDLLMATADNAAAGVADSECAGETFAQLLQGLPAEAISADATKATMIVDADAAIQAAPTTTITASVELPVIAAEAEATVLPVTTDSEFATIAAAATLASDNTEEFPLTTTLETSVEAETADATSSARMMAALRREFVPTPVLTSAVERPAKTATTQQASAQIANGDAVRPATTSDTKTASAKPRTGTVEKPALSHVTSADNNVDAVALTSADSSDSANTAADAQAIDTDQQPNKPVVSGSIQAGQHEIEATINEGASAETALPLTNADAPTTTATATRTSVALNTTALPALPQPTVNADDKRSNGTTTGKATVLKATGNRGGALPAGGNALPPTHSTHASSTTAAAGNEISTSAFASMLDGSFNRGAELTAPTYDNAARATVLPDSSVQSTALPAAVTTAATPSLANQPTQANNGELQLPPVFTSTLVMGTAGWSEETAQHIRWMQDDDMQSADIQLHPAELGRLDISIDFKDGQANVHLVAGSAEARELLEKSMPSLRELLAQSGMSLGNSNVAADHQGREARAQRFNAPLFQLTETSVKDLPQGRPALFRSHGGSNRIDYYV